MHFYHNFLNLKSSIYFAEGHSLYGLVMFCLLCQELSIPWEGKCWFENLNAKALLCFSHTCFRHTDHGWTSYISQNSYFPQPPDYWGTTYVSPPAAYWLLLDALHFPWPNLFLWTKFGLWFVVEVKAKFYSSSHFCFDYYKNTNVCDTQISELRLHLYCESYKKWKSFYFLSYLKQNKNFAN